MLSGNSISWYKSICKSHLWLPCCLFRWMRQSCGSRRLCYLISGVWLSYAAFSAREVPGTQSCADFCKCSFQWWLFSRGHMEGIRSCQLPGHSNKTHQGTLLCALDAKVGNLACGGTVLLSGTCHFLLLLLEIIYYELSPQISLSNKGAFFFCLFCPSSLFLFTLSLAAGYFLFIWKNKNLFWTVKLFQIECAWSYPIQI